MRNRLFARGVVHRYFRSQAGGGSVASLATVVSRARGGASGFWNTESRGAIHDALHTIPTYTCSEYGPSGTHSEDGTLMQNLEKTSFPDNAFETILSSEVFEHVARPYVAHQELLRVLSPGGCHVMSVPHGPDEDHAYAKLLPNDTIVHLREPEYHGEPNTRAGVDSSKGILVFTVFGAQSMSRTLRDMGYEVEVFDAFAPHQGVTIHETVFFLCKPK